MEEIKLRVSFVPGDDYILWNRWWYFYDELRERSDMMGSVKMSNQEKLWMWKDKNNVGDLAVTNGN